MPMKVHNGTGGQKAGRCGAWQGTGVSPFLWGALAPLCHLGSTSCGRRAGGRAASELPVAEQEASSQLQILCPGPGCVLGVSCSCTKASSLLPVNSRSSAPCQARGFRCRGSLGGAQGSIFLSSLFQEALFEIPIYSWCVSKTTVCTCVCHCS